MKLGDWMKTLINVNIVVALLFGLGFILMPVTLLDFYEVSLSEGCIDISFE
jgi:hypothetical protein